MSSAKYYAYMKKETVACIRNLTKVMVCVLRIIVLVIMPMIKIIERRGVRNKIWRML